LPKNILKANDISKQKDSQCESLCLGVFGSIAAGDRIASLIIRITRMTFDPVPSDIWRIKAIKLLPIFLIFDGLIVFSLPTVLFPALNPFGNAIKYIFTIGIEIDRG
jgi:hypothetical protein